MKTQYLKRLSMILLVLFAALLPFAGGCGDDDDDDSSDDTPPDDDGDDDDDTTDDDTTDDDTSDDDTGDDDTTDDDTVDDDTADDDTDIVVDAISANASSLPAQIESCALIDQEQCVGGTLHRCAIYDSLAGEFTDNPPEFLERILYYDRYGDLYQTKDFSQLVYYTKAYIEPGTDEAVWTDPANFDHYRDHGDAAFYMGYHAFAAAHRYAVTGTTADYQRMVRILDEQLGNWRITGVPGYMIRAVSAMLDEGVSVPTGHPEYNLREYKERSNHVLYTVTEPDLLALLPDYYYQGVTIDDVFYDTTPMIEGGPSLDAYSGAMLGFNFIYDLLKEEDQAYQDEIAEAVTCFIGRLRKLRITNIRESMVGRLLIDYLLGTGSVHLDPDDINLDDIDTMIGYVAEAIPPGDPGDFIFECRDTLPTEVDPKYDFDANDPLFILQFADLAYKLSGLGDYPIDFIYLVSHRGGDVAFMMNWMIMAYHVTGDQRYLDFVQNQLVDEIDGLAVLNTSGAFFLPPFCGSWIGGDLVHPILHASLMHLADGALAGEHRRTMKEELKDKLFLTDNNAYFGITYAAAVDETYDPDLPDYLEWAVAELDGYMLNPDAPLDPKRNYSTDYIADPLPGYEPIGPTQEQIDICEQGLEILGFEIIPGPGIDPDFEVIAPQALPVGMRVPHEMIWHFSPFNLKRDFGSAEGRRHYFFTDLTAPYWIGRYRGLIDDGGEGMALGWQDTGEPCTP